MWEVAESYLDELLSRNIIEVAGHLDGSPWKQQTYRVHDILLEVIVSKSLRPTFLACMEGCRKRFCMTRSAASPSMLM
jgi:disease resistance protein RPM1